MPTDSGLAVGRACANTLVAARASAAVNSVGRLTFVAVINVWSVMFFFFI
jgi:hypothetical protein